MMAARTGFRLAAPLAMLAGLVLAAAVPSAPPPQLSERCVTVSERQAAVGFTAHDGTHLTGVLLGTGNRTVVLAHAFGSNLCSWLPYGRTLATHGYRVLAFDFRSFGSSGSPTDGSNADRFEWDLEAAVRLVRNAGAHHVVLVGASIGATAVLVAASKIEPPVDATISVSPFALSLTHSDHGLSPLAAVRRSRVPVLFLASSDDPYSTDNARTLFRAASAHDKHLLLLPGAAHGSDLLTGPTGSRARHALDDFIRTHTTTSH